MTSEKRYEKSAVGDFYILSFGDHETYGSCCLAGGAPHLNAPQLCARDEFGTKLYCYVKAQPQNDYEIYQMIEAALWSEFRCLRYEGNDKEIIQRLADIGIAEEVCDNPLPENLSSNNLRNYCTVKVSDHAQYSPKNLANMLREYLLPIRLDREGSQATELEWTDEKSVSFSYTWTADRPDPIFHKINIQAWPSDFSDLLITHSLLAEQLGSIGMSLTIDYFLRESRGFSNLQWYSATEWRNGNPIFWRNTPY